MIIPVSQFSFSFSHLLDGFFGMIQFMLHLQISMAHGSVNTPLLLVHASNNNNILSCISNWYGEYRNIWLFEGTIKTRAIHPINQRSTVVIAT